ARAERTPRARDDHRPDARLRVERAKRVPQLAVHVERQGVEAFGAVERDGGGAGVGVGLVEEGLGCGHAEGSPGVGQGNTAVASISTAAFGSRSGCTCTSGMAGLWTPTRRRWTSPSGLRLAR